jgi:hypothetical protein
MTSGGQHRISDTFAYHLARGTCPPANPFVARLQLDAMTDARARTVGRWRRMS